MPHRRLRCCLLWLIAWWRSFHHEIIVAAEAGAPTPSSLSCLAKRTTTAFYNYNSRDTSRSSPRIPRRINNILEISRGGDQTTNDGDVLETNKIVAAPKKSRRSPLSTPFYMNEVARFEASVAAAVDNGSKLQKNATKIIEDSSTTANPDDAKKRDRSREEDKPFHDRLDGNRKHNKKKKKHHGHLDKDNNAIRERRPVLVDKETKMDGISTREKSIVAEREETDTKKERLNNDAANLWWVNMWTQQMADDDEEERQQELSNDEIESIQEVEAELILDSSDESDNIEDEHIDTEKVAVVVDKITPTYPDVAVAKEVIEIDAKPKDNVANKTEFDFDGNMTMSKSSSSYVSSGVWGVVDNLVTLGLASRYSSLRLSKQLRPIRKWTAHVTGLHGVLSGKPSSLTTSFTAASKAMEKPSNKDLQGIQRRIAAIDRARRSVDKARAVDEVHSRKRRGLFGGLFRDRRNNTDMASNVTIDGIDARKGSTNGVPQKSPKEIEEERQRMERVKEIDRLISEGQALLQNLICEKDVLQRRPNPLFEYTTVKSTKKRVLASEATDPPSNETSKETFMQETIEVQATRKMNFPPDELVAEYLDMMISTGRLVKMNHTYLWQESEVSDDEEETIGDDLFTASADAHRLYQATGRPKRNLQDSGNDNNGKGGNGGGGSWLLRQSLGGGPSLGEKIGEAAETAAYKAVCAALMSFLAKLLSSLHGVNVLKHSDIRLVLEQAPDLPLMGAEGILSGSDGNYAEETLKTVMRQKSKKRKKYSKHRPSDDSFVQRDAVTEMLLSHVQISAPLLKLFPLAWQRALLGNIITLATAVISDFLDGVRFQILGHELSFAFRPITEEDMIRHFQIMSGGRLNHRKYKAAEFEAAVRATAEDVSEELKFLDRWHERALGSGVLRTQIANLIARIVLTLTDEILSAARIDLWSAQAGGPRMLAGLEYRIESIDVEDE